MGVGGGPGTCNAHPYIYIYMYMALSQQTETSLCDHPHPCTPRRREAIEFPLISRYPGARPVAKPMSFGERRLRLSWWDKEKRACRCEISLKWKLVNCWVDNSWVFWFVLVFLSKRWADNVIRNERNRRGFDGFLSIFIFFSRITSWNVIPHLFHISSILGIWSNVFLFWWGWNHLQFERSLNCGSKHVEVESRCCSQRLFKIPHKPSPTGSIPTSSFSQLGGSVFNQHEDGICQPWLFWVYP